MPGKKSELLFKNDNDEIIIIYEKKKTKMKKVSFSSIVKIINIESFKKYNI